MKFAFTFGFNTNLRSNFVTVEATDHEEARNKYVEKYGEPSFAFMYTFPGFESDVQVYNLTEVPFGTQPIKRD